MTDSTRDHDVIDDRIWITSRVRMTSERRALRNNFYSLIMLTYYSLFTVILAIFSDFFKHYYSIFDDFAVAATVAVLVASLIVSGFRFERSAALFRECYLRLQRLHSEIMPEAEKSARYADILEMYDNHSIHDYNDLIVYSKVFERKTLNNGTGEIECTFWMYASFLFRKTLFYAMIISLFVAPVAFAAAPALGMVPNELAPAL